MNVDTPVPAPEKAHAPWRVIQFISSLKLCVVLLTLSAFGVFFGTLAQVHEGLYQAQERWFKAWFILRRPGDDWYVWAYPGGYLLGVLLLINLITAHLRRFKFPPGGWWVLIPHYLLVMVGLYYISHKIYDTYNNTQGTSWTPLLLVLVFVVLLVVDMTLAAPALKQTRLIASGRKIGVDFVHFGIVVLLGGQLATDMLAQETHMSFKVRETKRYSESWADSEIAVIRDNTADPSQEDVVSIPQRMIVKDEKALPDEVVKPANLPFTVKVLSWMPNSETVLLKEAAEKEAQLRQAMASLETRYSNIENLPGEARRATEFPGRAAAWRRVLRNENITPADDLEAQITKLIKDPPTANNLLEKFKTAFREEMIDAFKDQGPNARYAVERIKNDPDGSHPPPEPQATAPMAKSERLVSLKPTYDMESRNVPSAIVELTGTAGPLGTWLVSHYFGEQTIDYGGTKWRLCLRPERVYHPFSVKLMKTTHKVYQGTDNPRDFRSQVRLENPATGENRETEIFMNAPLRYQGLTFFQNMMGRDELDRTRGTSTLQVVRNPSWFSPYFGCALVSYGMLRHFMLHLFRFTRKRRTS